MTLHLTQIFFANVVVMLSQSQGVGPTSVKECAEQGKCYWKGDCKSPGRRRMWQSEEECADMWCHAYHIKKYIAIRVQRFYGCRYKDQCRKKDEVWEETGCVKRRCLISGPRGYERMVTVSQLGCLDKRGACHYPGNTWEEDCVRYQCVNKNNKTSIRAVQKVISRGCPFNGTCIAEGGVATDPERKCITKRCVVGKRKTGGFFRSVDVDTIKCQDANGICHDESEKGWPLSIHGTLYNNCHCNITRKPDGSVSIRKGCE
ncbi:uncharacterized protein LOC125665827 [Ostrea edulis]|uniref:uncharacterized protein LOC125665827 n=1 Tax=Ostrea edulis TaxID=37623 RepID=UPI0024AFDAB8|nr:uncharacterized protein LOC125665827 [Ostrea edulis]